MILQDFYTILQSAIGKTVQLSHTLSEKEWNEIFGLAKKQARKYSFTFAPGITKAKVG